MGKCTSAMDPFGIGHDILPSEQFFHSPWQGSLLNTLRLCRMESKRYIFSLTWARQNVQKCTSGWWVYTLLYKGTSLISKKNRLKGSDTQMCHEEFLFHYRWSISNDKHPCTSRHKSTSVTPVIRMNSPGWDPVNFDWGHATQQKP